MSTAIQRLDSKWYPECTDNSDDELFRSAIARHIDGTSRLLDLGVGAGIVPHIIFKGMAAHVSGVDLDPRVLTNPFLVEARIGSAEKLPYADGALFADNVPEHLPQARGHVLRDRACAAPGGRFLAKNPNKWLHAAYRTPDAASFSPLLQSAARQSERRHLFDQVSCKCTCRHSTSRRCRRPAGRQHGTDRASARMPAHASWNLPSGVCLRTTGQQHRGGRRSANPADDELSK